MFQRTLIAALLGVASASSGAAREPGDARFEFRITEGAFGLTSIRIAGQRMRVDWGPESIIVEVANGTILTVNHERKEFSRITDANREAFFKGVSDAMAEFRKSVKELTAEDRRELLVKQPELAALMDGGGVSTESGGEMVVAGRKCAVQRFTLNNVPWGEVCVATPASLALPEKDAAAFKLALSVLSSHTKRLEKLLPQAAANTAILSESSVPLRQTTVALGVRHTSEFVGISHDPLAMDLFSVPAGYTEVKPGG